MINFLGETIVKIKSTLNNVNHRSNRKRKKILVVHMAGHESLPQGQTMRWAMTVTYSICHELLKIIKRNFPVVTEEIKREVKSKT